VLRHIEVMGDDLCRPEASVAGANARPMLPKPSTPTVCPPIRRTVCWYSPVSSRRWVQAPSRVVLTASGIRRVNASSIAIAWSATSAVLTPGTLQASTPRPVAASRSIESMTTPIRLTTFSFGHASITSCVVSGIVPTCAPSASFSGSIKSSVLATGPSTTSKPADSKRSTRLYGLMGRAIFTVGSTLGGQRRGRVMHRSYHPLHFAALNLATSTR